MYPAQQAAAIPMATSPRTASSPPVVSSTPASATTPAAATTMPSRSRQVRPVTAATATGPRNSIATAVPSGSTSIAT